MPRTKYEKTYACTVCGTEVSSQQQLTVKKAVFQTMGSKGKTVKSRVVHWLCPPCLKKDIDWNREPYSEPGTPAPAPVSDDQLSIPLA